MDAEFMIYGCYGYTGRLVVAEAQRRGHRPLLAGRDAGRVEALAHETGLPWTAIALDEPENLARTLSQASVVLHCAGPFSRTARPMVDACLATGAHYLDITGEIAVFESLAARDAEARDAGIVMMPGTGFDVVPSDSLAAWLNLQVPGATALTLAIRGGGRLSHGTATTMVENAGLGGAVRRDGRIVRVPAAYKSRMVDFGDGPQLTITIPWGDVSTAWYTTRIPDIEVYAAATPAMRRNAIIADKLAPIVRLGPVQRFLKRRIDAAPAGPSEASRARTTSQVWGEIRSESGTVATGSISGPNGYDLTAMSSVRIAEAVAQGLVKPGFHTPAGALGPDFVLALPGVNRAAPAPG